MKFDRLKSFYVDVNDVFVYQVLIFDIYFGFSWYNLKNKVEEGYLLEVDNPTGNLKQIFDRWVILNKLKKEILLEGECLKCQLFL